MILSEISINQNTYHFQASISDPKETVYVFLHGFLGSKEDYQPLLTDFPQQYLALDLLGFGENRTCDVLPDDFTQTKQVDELHQIFQRLHLSKIILVGYSMGGRIAIAYALKYPNTLDHLVLESTTAGISDEKLRQKRQQHDAKLAEKLMNSGMEKFVSDWEKLPLFASQQTASPAKISFMHQQRIQQNPQNAANSLLMMGTGKQPNYWDKLDPLSKLSVVVIAGDEDKKFVKIGSKLHQKIRGSKLLVVQNVGHNIHFEKPDIFKKILLDID
ncbi:2-succinyl-6-hydroxy-2,4-cyclohexadiene-1-carboxylate synthase [Companilactobacillus furfuricola]|uniref:2-succinyl-6-hydroxy-2, 4-cyclohexadiene-1-carboxylate synthase n=1 Tax=Companilactobacillus furfuricola TaxID=1462575 RepID=UPI000F779C3B|nr:2-succinyl-6-hydroxy-2,4-cyclohexadiene-1-carboxylate synthase [Companilactobacillus furfuricola]